ncbi:MAG TPA: AI-2E family transporter [Deltaproteobacteria bacterium]|nr:AI-2E family transporter [Deltaproteobacteria bacterium]
MNEKPFATFQNIIFFVLLGIITLFFGYLLKAFFFAIFWAVLLAGIFSPLNNLLLKRVKYENLSAGITLFAVIVCLILPASFLINLLIAEFMELYKAIDSDRSRWVDNITAILNYLNQYPFFARLDINFKFLTVKSAEALKAFAEFIFKNLSGLTQNTIILIIQVIVMFYSLFFFLRDGDKFINAITHYIPAGKHHMDTFIRHFLTTAKATLKITFVIGGLQGLLGGLLFYFTGIERALIWGVLMFGLAVVPAVGCSLIWLPAGIIMLFQGHILQGIIILAFGSVVIGGVDTMLRPILVGHGLQMHTLLIFLSMLGGLAVFGISGFVLGPVIASLFLASWRLFLELYKKEEVEQ